MSLATTQATRQAVAPKSNTGPVRAKVQQAAAIKPHRDAVTPPQKKTIKPQAAAPAAVRPKTQQLQQGAGASPGIQSPIKQQRSHLVAPSQTPQKKAVKLQATISNSHG
jgi:hypothetical protein